MFKNIDNATLFIIVSRETIVDICVVSGGKLGFLCCFLFFCHLTAFDCDFLPGKWGF